MFPLPATLLPSAFLRTRLLYSCIAGGHCYQASEKANIFHFGGFHDSYICVIIGFVVRWETPPTLKSHLNEGVSQPWKRFAAMNA